MGDYNYMYFATYIIDVAALFYLIVLLYSSTTLNARRKKPFLIAIILTLIIILSEVFTILFDNGIINLRSINILCNVLGFALAPMIPIAITLIFDMDILKHRKYLLVPTLVNMVAVVLSPIYRFIFYVDARNLYTRGDYFFLFVIVYMINLLILVFLTLEIGLKNNYAITGKMVFLSFFTILGTSIQVIHPYAYTSWHCVTLSLFLYFLLISEFDSSFDTLTNLYNRAAFDKAVKNIEETEAFSLIVLDINDFKVINDTYGHDYGDSAIKQVAAVIRKSFSKQYICYRIGGDEFYIIGNGTTKEDIEYHLRIMTNSLTELRENGNIIPTVAYGYSIFSGGEKGDFNKMLKEADDQMYYYKKIHKTNVTQKTTDIT